MNTEDTIYMDVTPIDLWRLGVKNSPRLDKLRIPPRPNGASIDIRTYEKNGAVWVKSGTGRISTFDGMNPRLSGADWWRIPKNSKIPTGLKISKNHTDRVLSITHYRIEPIFDMPLPHLIYLLKEFSKFAKKISASSTKEKV